MKPELDQALVRDFPNLYADRNAPMQQTAMCWGFPGDGWEPIIRELSEKLEPIAAATADSRYPIKATQVKEKYGGLRFYLTYYSEEAEKYIREAEQKARETCERCGEPGYPNDKGWIRTLCEEHHKERT